MNVVFLDFDGVITTPKTKWNISLEHVKRIKKICDDGDAKLVISSSWQRYAGTKSETREERVANWLSGILMKGYRGVIKKFFKDYTYDMSGRFYHEYGNVRGSDIKSWLVRHPEVDNYVIIDDEDDMLDEQLYHFVSTDWVFGIQDREVVLAIEVLKRIPPRNSFSLNHVLMFKRWQKFNMQADHADYDTIYEKYYPFKKQTSSTVATDVTDPTGDAL